MELAITRERKSHLRTLALGSGPVTVPALFWFLLRVMASRMLKAKFHTLSDLKCDEDRYGKPAMLRRIQDCLTRFFYDTPPSIPKRLPVEGTQPAVSQ